jgi:hypothetical protein
MRGFKPPDCSPGSTTPAFHAADPRGRTVGWDQGNPDAKSGGDAWLAKKSFDLFWTGACAVAAESPDEVDISTLHHETPMREII